MVVEQALMLMMLQVVVELELALLFPMVIELVLLVDLELRRCRKRLIWWSWHLLPRWSRCSWNFLFDFGG